MLYAAEVGARYATRVRVAAQQGSAFNGEKGVAVRPLSTDTILVRFPRRRDLVLPFGRSEVEVLP